MVFFAVIGLMFVYVRWTNERFLIDPESEAFFTAGTAIDEGLRMFATIMAMRFILLKKPEGHRQWI